MKSKNLKRKLKNYEESLISVCRISFMWLRYIGTKERVSADKEHNVMNIEEGKTYYFYVDRYTDDDVCKAHVLHVLPHPEGNDDKLIVFRWYERHRKCWRHGVTTISQQELWKDYVNKVLACRKDERKRCKTCGMCGYYMCQMIEDFKTYIKGE